MTRLAQRGSGGHEYAGAGKARRQLIALEGRVGGPKEVGLALRNVEVALAQRGGETRALLADHTNAPVQQVRAAAQRLQRSGL